MTTRRYIRKPLIVDAVRITEENIEEVAVSCGGRVLRSLDDRFSFIQVPMHRARHNTENEAGIGSWLLTMRPETSTRPTYRVYRNEAFERDFLEMDPEYSEDEYGQVIGADPKPQPDPIANPDCPCYECQRKRNVEARLL